MHSPPHSNWLRLHREGHSLHSLPFLNCFSRRLPTSTWVLVRVMATSTRQAGPERLLPPASSSSSSFSFSPLLLLSLSYDVWGQEGSQGIVRGEGGDGGAAGRGRAARVRDGTNLRCIGAQEVQLYHSNGCMLLHVWVTGAYAVLRPQGAARGVDAREPRQEGREVRRQGRHNADETGQIQGGRG